MFTVVLIGRSNVGKSTLFNYLTESRRALVRDAAEITRDYQCGYGSWQGDRYAVIDTGGLALSQQTIAQKTEQQALKALEKAQVVFFVVDAQAGCTAYDMAIARKLRAFKRPIYLLVNKVDRLASELLCADFHGLGLGIPWAVAAVTGRGIQPLLAEVFQSNSLAETSSEASVEATCIAVLGRPNVGKSTLINRMVREERLIVSEEAGTTRDSIEVPHTYKGQLYTLVDTAGVRRTKQVQEAIEKFSIAKTWTAVAQADIVLVLLDVSQGISEQDKRLLGIAVQKGAGLVIVFNKVDLCSVEERAAFQKEVERQLGFVQHAQYCFISGLSGKGLGALYRAIDKVSCSLAMDCNTAKITAILEEAVRAHVPPLENGRRIKMRYAHVCSKKPFTILVHGKQLDKLPQSYLRYLSHHFRKALGLSGVFVHIETKNDKNPYQ